MRRILLMFGIAFGVLLMAVSGAGAEPITHVTPIAFSDYTRGVHGKVGNKNLFEYATGLITVKTDNGTTAYAYCIDVLVTIHLNKIFTQQPWDSSHVDISEANLARINWILHQYPASATVAKGVTNGALEAAAVQSAIWHFSDAFEIARDGSNDAPVVSQYDAIVAAAASHNMPEPPTSLTISPASDTAVAGSNAGPFTVATSASGPVTLAITNGSASIVNCTTGTTVTSVTNGQTFCLTRTTAGAATVTGTAAAPVAVGTVLVDLAETNQKLIMATTAPGSAVATAAGTWTSSSPTPPSVTIACPSGGFIAGQPATFTASPSGGTGPYTYEWSKNGSVIAGATGQSITVTLASTDTLTVKVTDTASGLTATANAPCVGSTSHPAITITKVANPTSVTGPAGVVFTYVITNSGNVPLKLASLVDDHGTPANAADDLPIADFKNCNTSAVMLPGASITCTIGYQLPKVTVVTSQTNTVVVVGTPVTPAGTPTGQPPVTDTAQAKVVNNPVTAVLGEQVPNTPETPAAQAATTTTVAPAALPRTGSGATIPLVLTGLFLLLTGAVIETGRRRRRS